MFEEAPETTAVHTHVISVTCVTSMDLFLAATGRRGWLEVPLPPERARANYCGAHTRYVDGDLLTLVL